MISTFENAERQHLRRLERERHMTILNTITGDETFLQLSLENDDIIPTLDTVAGEPRATPVRGESQASETNKQHRWLRNNTVWVVGVMLIVTTILLAFTLGVDLGEKEVTVSNSKPVIDDVDDSPPLHAEGLQRYNYLFSQILDWEITPRDVLENVTTAPARALHWLSYEDTMVLKEFGTGISVETIRTRFALASLYFSTQSTTFVNDAFSRSSWVDKTLWLTGYSVCQWFGVECMEDEFGQSSLGRVKSLNLSSNGLEGQIPDELGLFQLDIRALDLSGNAIGGTIPETISALKNLNDLYLGPNRLRSSIPEVLYQLSHLTHLYLNDCTLSGPISTSIGNLKSIQGLGLHKNALSGTIPEQIGAMENIQAIYLDTNQLTGKIPSTLGQLTGLVDLRLRRNDLNGTIPLEMESLRVLQILYMDSNRISGLIPPSLLGSFRFMRDLQLYNNLLTGPIPTEVGQLLFLNILYLDGNQLDAHLPTTLGALSNLENLYLFSNQLQGFIPTKVGEMVNLKNLRVHNNSLSGPIPEEVGALKNLEMLYLNNNALGGPIPSALEKLTTVKSVLLHANRFTGTVPPAMCSFEYIAELTSDCGGDEAEVECECCTSCYQS